MSLRSRVATGILGFVSASVMIAGVVAAPVAANAAPAPTIRGNGMMSEASIRARLLPLKQVERISGTMPTLTTDGVECHDAPYIKNGNVRYCYYVTLRSNNAYKAGRPSATHVDVLSFDSPTLGRDYLKEMDKVGTPQARTVNKSATGLTRIDPAAQIPVGVNADGTLITRTGAQVTVYKWVGWNFAYATCANPNGRLTGLQSCAQRLVDAQVKRLP